MARNLLAIDPGNCAGWAIYLGASLDSAGVTNLDAAHCPALAALSACRVDLLVIEVPQVYRAGDSKGDPNDLIKLAVGVGRWVERARICGIPYSMHRPNEWKGQIPKSIHAARAESALRPAERALLPAMASSMRHNMLDAIALGLWKLGRLR